MSVTVNDKIKNALNIYHQGLKQKISGEFVAKVAGKNLSTNDFTDEDKTKLDSISTDTFVTKVAGKNLSTNDFTNEAKAKLDSISTDTSTFSLYVGEGPAPENALWIEPIEN